MKKIVFFFLLCHSVVFGNGYDMLLLKAQASIFPKILLLDKNIDKKLVDGKIVYVIVYREDDLFTALKIRDLIELEHEHHLGRYGLAVRLLKYSEISPDIEAAAIYALRLPEAIEKVAQIA